MSYNPLRRVASTFGAVVTLALGALFIAPTFAAGAEPDLSKTLHVSMKFTQATYNPGDTAHLTVTLMNSDSSPLRGVQAACTGAGFPNELRCTGPGWAPLTNGVDLAAGETKTIDVWETVPAVAADYGDVGVVCFFGPNAQYPVNLPTAQAQAKVPGVVIDYRMTLSEGTNPIANTKVYALDPDTKQIVGRAVTDAAGVLEFKGIRAGLYQIYVVGPWQSWDGKPIIFSIRRPESGHMNMELKPGPDQPDLGQSGGTKAPAMSVPTTSVTSTAAGAGAGGTAKPTSMAAATTTAASSTSTATLPNRLPNTGADVFGPMAAGLALLAAGAGALLVARRRKATN